MAVGEVLRMRRTPIDRGREDSAIESGEGNRERRTTRGVEERLVSLSTSSQTMRWRFDGDSNGDAKRHGQILG